MRRTRKDALPEHTDYVDNGCNIAVSCLSCVLPACKYDREASDPRVTTIYRADRIDDLRTQGYKYDEIARMLGVSKRTVFKSKQTARQAKVNTP